MINGKIWTLVRVGFYCIRLAAVSSDPQVEKSALSRFGIGNSSQALFQYEWFAGMPVWAKANCIRYLTLTVTNFTWPGSCISNLTLSSFNSKVIHHSKKIVFEKRQIADTLENILLISLLIIFTANDVKLQIACQNNNSSTGGLHSLTFNLWHSTDICDTSFNSSVPWTDQPEGQFPFCSPSLSLILRRIENQQLRESDLRPTSP